MKAKRGGGGEMRAGVGGEVSKYKTTLHKTLVPQWRDFFQSQDFFCKFLIFLLTAYDTWNKSYRSSLMLHDGGFCNTCTLKRSLQRKVVS